MWSTGSSWSSRPAGIASTGEGLKATPEADDGRVAVALSATSGTANT